MLRRSEIELKTSGEVDAMREAGRVVARCLDAVRAAAAPGVSLKELDGVAHAVPGPHRLAPGDLLSIDCGAFLDGWCGDAAISLVVGDDPDPADVDLIATTERALAAGIAAAVPGHRLGDVR